MAIDIKKMQEIIKAKDDQKSNASKKSPDKQYQEIKKDNTVVNRVIPDYNKVEYKYLGNQNTNYAGLGDASLKGTADSQDSLNYQKGFKSGYNLASTSDEDELGSKYKYGSIKTGFNPRFNEGFSEGKDKALKEKELNAKEAGNKNK